MAFSIEEIEDLLDGLPGDKFRFDKMDEDALTYTGALRTQEGQNVVEPSPESASMIIALRGTIDFLVAAPQIVKQLLETLAHNEAQATAVAPPEQEAPKTAEKPISLPGKG